jgi:hypothetical protein
MREAAGGTPEIGASARSLGIRPGIDVTASSANDIVQPGTGGLSVSPDDPMNLPHFRRPAKWQGTGKDPVWTIDDNALSPELCYRPDPARAGHGFIEPAHSMTLDEFEQAIARTCRDWKKW